MKTKIASLFALLVALSSSVLAASSSATAAASAPFGFNLGKIVQPNNDEIARGATEMTVLRVMGTAMSKLAPNVWVYYGYHPVVADGQDRGCDTLLITFADGKVSDLKLVNARATAVIATNLKHQPAGVMVAQK